MRRTRIIGEFDGWDPGRVYQLADGPHWQMTASRAVVRYMYRYNPAVEILAGGGLHYLRIRGDRWGVAVHCIEKSPWPRSRAKQRELVFESIMQEFTRQTRST